MASPMPPWVEPLPTPPATAKPWRGEATLSNGMVCTYVMADTVAVAQKKEKFLKGGPENMIIISDFDRTISTASYTERDGKKIVGQTAYSLLSDSKVISEATRQKMKSYHSKYFPMEFDPTIGFEAKYKLMDEWWAASNGALIGEKATMDVVFESVLQAKMNLRPGFAMAVQMAYQHDIPVIVFSAGLTQIIEHILRKLGPTDLMFPNVHVVANDLVTDEHNIVVAVKEPLMHSLNKKDTSVAMVSTDRFEWFSPLRCRSNVLLLGDNLGDANMSDGYDQDTTCIMKVGFLNANEEGLLEQYSRTFDIVVLHDGPMVPVATFLQEIIGTRVPIHATPLVPE